MLKSAKVWVLSAAAGAGLGLLFRLTLHFKPFESAGGYLTLAYLALAPAAMGWLAVWQYLRRTPAESIRWYAWFFLPWASVLLMLVGAALSVLEVAICILMASPILLVFSMIGGLLARLVWARFRTSP